MIRLIPPIARWAVCLSLAAFFHPNLYAQTARTARETALLFLRENPAQFNLSAQDVADVRVVDEYHTEGLGVTHVWVQQQHRGIPVFNALFGLHVKSDGQVQHLGHRFAPDLAARTNTHLPALGAPKALELAMLHLGFEGFAVPEVRQKINDRNWVFAGGAVSRSDIPVSICYEQGADGRIRLAWTMLIDQANTSDYWNLRVDALTGQIIGQLNHTNYCKAGHAHRLGEACEADSPTQTTMSPNPPSGDGSKYRVFPFPTESPQHGSHVLVSEPADPVASPYGWHDTNGVAGPEYTHTRGNNVFAYEDADGNNNPPGTPRPVSNTLNFDYPFNPALEPSGNMDAAITNLFYVNNMMHDITYRYGFSEIARNFQVNNYGAAGAPNDPVLAEAIDGSGENNANFATPPDGTSGRMQMYRWARQGGKIVTVNSPSGIVGKYFAAGAAGWGKPISTIPVTGDVVIANDGSSTPTWACNPLINNAVGKIVMADRSSCTFGEKALNAQKAGAIACIICNLQDGTINMGPGTVGNQVTIPVVMMPKSDCALLRQYVTAGLNVSIGFDATVTGPNFLDGDFDNGIVAHEYGHGISNRLTGFNASCLGNSEQMGEGWSDFFTLITTARTGDVGSKRRGVGTYVLNQATDGTGIRRYPYSTDMSINPLDYSFVAENTEVHAVGEVWTAMTWDLYWAMVDKYGFDPNITNTNSGNGRAIQLVMDGMKLQPCNPGFQDGRDAILRANVLRYGGADTCLISSVFARRGLGYYASQGSAYNASDGKANFDPIPYCIKNLKISKTTSTPTITAGDEVAFSIKVANHKDDPATNVRVTDELPAGLTFVSASDGGKFENGFVVWELGTMPSLAAKTLTYKAKSASNIGCDVYFNDDMETTDDWLSNAPNKGYFELQNTVAKTGTHAWLAQGTNEQGDFTLQTTIPFTVQGSRPHLRFWHRHETEIGVDAGFVEVQIEGQNNWTAIPADKVVRNPYAAKIPYSTFAIASLSGFSGQSNGWIQSYMDLSNYIGQDIKIRFRVGTNVDGGIVPLAQWYVDDLEQVQLVNFDGQACVTYTGGTSACAKAPESGVIVNRGVSSLLEAAINNLPIQVQPNPTSGLLNITLSQSASGPVHLSLIGADGRTLLSDHRDRYTEGQIITLSLNQIPTGLYLLRVQTSVGLGTEKIIVGK